MNDLFETVWLVLFSVGALVILLKSAVNVIRVRKYYKRNALRVTGTVTEWNLTGKYPNLWIDMEIGTPEGTYSISTQSFKALKYRWKKSVTMLVVEEAEQPDWNQRYHDGFFEKMLMVLTTVYGASNEQDDYPDVMLKEELKSPLEVIFLMLFACLFAGLLILIFAGSIKEFLN